MSEVISLSTFHNHNLTDQDHALFMQTVTSQSGLFYGCEVTLKDENTLHVSTGEGIACGRIFRIMDMDYPVELSASGDLLGRLYVHIDTALDDTPAQLMDVQGSTLPALIQEDDMNQSTGVYEIELATFSINELGISNLEFTAPKATGGGAGGKSIAPDYSAAESYEIGRIFFQNGTLYKTIAAIPAGAPLVLDTNVVETSLAAEIEALNQNLMQKTTWHLIGSQTGIHTIDTGIDIPNTYTELLVEVIGDIGDGFMAFTSWVMLYADIETTSPKVTYLNYSGNISIIGGAPVAAPQIGAQISKDKCCLRGLKWSDADHTSTAVIKVYGR